uniref:Uncharacterized protein n=1 Tax=Siphoviridae sp. ctxMM9 TaxID=2827973 RepID=A0A8S5T6I7_9CAUD|nr:MAG TPA: hypothetical protein [Siphoviridae sp. ctxMM9]
MNRVILSLLLSLSYFIVLTITTVQKIANIGGSLNSPQNVALNV